MCLITMYKDLELFSLQALFEGLRFTMSGAVPGYTRQEFEQNVLHELGAELAVKFSKKTDYLLSTPSQVSIGMYACEFAFE